MYIFRAVGHCELSFCSLRFGCTTGCTHFGGTTNRGRIPTPLVNSCSYKTWLKTYSWHKQKAAARRHGCLHGKIPSAETREKERERERPMAYQPLNTSCCCWDLEASPWKATSAYRGKKTHKTSNALRRRHRTTDDERRQSTEPAPEWSRSMAIIMCRVSCR